MVKDLNDPTNRDSVHAMLTPGEYVLNKEATNMYGPVIEQMNNHGLQQRHAENQVVMANMGQQVSPQHFSRGGIVDFIKQEEGFRNKAYRDPIGKWTIGYGRTTNPDGSPIRPGQTTTRDQENSWVDRRVAQERDAVIKYGKQHGYSWNPSQVDALASFRYNGGHGMLEQVTGGGKRDDAAIGQKILQYNKGTIDGKKVALPGLTKRRQAEAGMFSGSYKASARTDNGQTQQRTQQKTTQQPDVPKDVPPPKPQGFGEMVGSEIESAMGGIPRELLERSLKPSKAPSHLTSRKFTSAEYIPSSAQQRGPISSNPQKKKRDQYNAGGWVVNAPPPPPTVGEMMTFFEGGSVPLHPQVYKTLVGPLGLEDGGSVEEPTWTDYAQDVGEYAVEAWQNPLVRGAVEVGGGFVPGVSEALDVYTIGEGVNNLYEGNYGEGAVDIGLGAAGLAIPFASNTQLKGGYKLAKGGIKAVDNIATKYGPEVADVAFAMAKRHGGHINKYIGDAIRQVNSGIAGPDNYGLSKELIEAAHGISKSGGEYATSGLKKAKEWTDAGVQSLQNLWGSEEEPEEKNTGGPISIKPENRGKFTQKADAAGMGVQSYAKKVLSAPEGRYDTSTREQANFARNANKWSK